MANRINGIRLHVHLIGYTFSAPREILFLSLEGKKLSYQTKNMLVNNKKCFNKCRKTVFKHEL